MSEKQNMSETSNVIGKSQLIEVLAAELGNAAAATRAFDALLETVTLYLRQGARVKLTGIGTLSLKHAPARTGRNFRTGETIQVPARMRLKVSQSSQL